MWVWAVRCLHSRPTAMRSTRFARSSRCICLSVVSAISVIEIVSLMMRVPFSSGRRSMRSLAALAVISLGAGGLLLAPAVAALAEEPPSGSASLSLLSQQSGQWLDGGPSIEIATNLVCPAETDSIIMFVAEPGNERPDVKDAAVTYDSAYPLANPNGAFYPLSDPGMMYSPPRSSWHSDGGVIKDVTAELQANHTYSLGLACAAYKDLPNWEFTFLLVPQDGLAVAAWLPIYTDADKNWSTSPGKSTPVVALTGTADSDTAITATVELKTAAGDLATDATGQVEFKSNSLSVGKADVVNGRASKKITGLTAETDYRLSASFTAAATDTKYSDVAFGSTVTVTTSAAVTPPDKVTPPDALTPPGTPTPPGTETPLLTDVPSGPVELLDGGVVEPGKAYTVNAPAGTFEAGDVVAGALHSDPIALTETATAGADGSVVYSFTAPGVLPSGAHDLVLSGTPSGKTFTLQVTVPVPGESLAVVPQSNDPFTPLTAWVSTAAGTPAGVAGLFAMLVGLVAVVAVGWNFLLKRRPANSL